MFIKELVWSLFGEGNDVFREGDWTKSIEMYTEALNIADYADSEDICVPIGLQEKLYANRAAAYLNIIPVSMHFILPLSLPPLWDSNEMFYFTFAQILPRNPSVPHRLHCHLYTLPHLLFTDGVGQG